MKCKIAKDLVPIKAHFFFFFAALGPILPQLNVFGRQLGISPSLMGMVTAVLPLLWALAKPSFGYIVDYWPTRRKLIFMLLILVMTASYCFLWFIPVPTEAEPPKLHENVYQLNDTIYLKQYRKSNNLEKYNCHWNCSFAGNFDVFLSSEPFINTIYVDSKVSNKSCAMLSMDFNDDGNSVVTCFPKENCNLICYEHGYSNQSKISVNESDTPLSDVIKLDASMKNEKLPENKNIYKTLPFWWFVILMSVGTVAFNVANCIGDAVCFDVLGENRASKYGNQRAWGTAGYGITALIGGYLIDYASGDSEMKDFTPAFLIMIVATLIDLYSCRKLTLPSLRSPDDSGKALLKVMKIPRVVVFTIFAVVVGTFDSFIIYYAFWFLEEIAEEQGYQANIKLIEGVVVWAQSFVGEVVFFFFSGAIIKRLGYGITLSITLLCYGIRMLLISMISNPWHFVPVEGIMQGPTYALTYATIVGYAAHVAPEGYSATVQGILGGMDDGVGFTLGSILGGQLYGHLGGRRTFRIMAIIAAASAAIHLILFHFVTKRHTSHVTERKEDQLEASTEEGEKMLQVNSGAIYNDTVIPLNSDLKVDK